MGWRVLAGLYVVVLGCRPVETLATEVSEVEPTPGSESRTRGSSNSPVALPGPCVAVPDTVLRIIEHRSGHGYDRYENRQIDVEKDYSWTLAPNDDLDFDRDGVADRIVPVDGGKAEPYPCPRSVRWALWVTRGACGHRVGTISGDLTRAADPSATRMEHGLTVLSSTRRPSGPDAGAVDYVYTFDGSSYVETSTTIHDSRCSVHPSDCDPLIRSSCSRAPP